MSEREEEARVGRWERAERDREVQEEAGGKAEGRHRRE